MNGGGRAALYARVSTEDQAREGFSLEAQVSRLRAYCAAQGWAVVREYVDDGHSGRDVGRPAYAELIADREAWDKIVVLKMDRIHRNARNFMAMMDALEAWGKDFVSATESLDTSTAMGRFVMDIIQRIAQLESEVLRERVKMGMTEKHRTGKGLNGFQRPFGYRYHRGRLEVLEDEASVVRFLFRRRASGATLGELARLLDGGGIRGPRGGRCSKSGIRYILRNPVYAGRVRWDGETREGRHEPIVDRDLWEAVQVG